MNGGFGRGKIIDEGFNSSYSPRSHFAEVDNGRGSYHRNSFSGKNNFNEYNRYDRENNMDHFRGHNREFGAFDNGRDHSTSTFTRGGRGGFSADHKSDSGFPSRYGDRDNDLLAENGENRGFSSRGGRGNGFGLISSGRGAGFGSFTGGRGGFGVRSSDDRVDGFDAVGGDRDGFRSFSNGLDGFGSRNGRGGGFGSSSDDRVDGFRSFSNGRGGFGSRNGRGGGFGSSSDDRVDGFDAVGGDRDGLRSFSNGRDGFGSRNGRGGGFGSSSDDRVDGFRSFSNGRGSFGSRNGRGGGFGSSSDDRADGFDAIDGGRDGFGSRNGRGGGFGSSSSGRGGGFGSSGGDFGVSDELDDDFDAGGFANRNRGYRGGRVFTGRHFGSFHSESNGFGRDERFDKFGNSDNGFSSGRGLRSTNGFDLKPRLPSHIPENRTVEEMYEEDAENAKYEINDLDQEVTIKGVPHLQTMLKLENWKNAGFGDLLLRNIIERSCYSVPRRIQAAVIPLIQNGWDIFGQAETGSGKTAAFILPIISYIMTNGEQTDSRCAPIALIIAPTRELVGQLYNQARKFAEGTGVTVAKAYGQYKIMENIMELERGCNLLFATMGRLKDFVERGKVKLHCIRFFVLDEADRMLSQDSFQTDIVSLVKRPGFPSVKDRQTLLFSATFTPDVQDLAAKIMKDDHAFVSNGKTIAANPLVEQNFIEVTAENKFDKLIQLLEEDRENNGDVTRTLVFVQRKQMADVMALNLVQKDIKSSSISGDRVQKQREEALRDFRKGDINVLVATDVCARGIDVKDLQHVINYDMPNDRVTYVHRIGRTGRLHRGKATSFIDLADQDPALIDEIIQVVQEAQQILPDFLLDFVKSRGGRPGFMDNEACGMTAVTDLKQDFQECINKATIDVD